MERITKPHETFDFFFSSQIENCATTCKELKIELLILDMHLGQELDTFRENIPNSICKILISGNQESLNHSTIPNVIGILEKPFDWNEFNTIISQTPKVHKPSLRYLNDLSEGDEEFTDQMLKVARTEINGDLKMINNHIENQDGKSVGLALHKVQSKIRMFDQVYFSTRCKKVEMALKEGSPLETHTEEIKAILIEIGQLESWITEQIKKRT